MQNSAWMLSESPDFLPTTAGSLCGSPHLGQKQAFAARKTA